MFAFLEGMDPDRQHFFTVAIIGYILAFIVSVASVYVEAPYGKLASGKHLKVGILKIPEIPLNPRLGWCLMELPATLSFLTFYPRGRNWNQPLPLFLAALFLLHYANRGFYFPYNIKVAKGQVHNFSIIIVAFGWIVTPMHGYLSAKWYGDINEELLDPSSYMTRPHFILGFLLYEFGYWNTIYCEHILRTLRTDKPNEPRYKIPRGGGFDYVTNAPYFFELVGWFGFALMTLSPGGLMVFLVSCANLVPRAFQVHQWYREKFGEDYPKQRMVLIPFVL